MISQFCYLKLLIYLLNKADQTYAGLPKYLKGMLFINSKQTHYSGQVFSRKKEVPMIACMLFTEKVVPNTPVPDYGDAATPENQSVFKFTEKFRNVMTSIKNIGIAAKVEIIDCFSIVEVVVCFIAPQK